MTTVATLDTVMRLNSTAFRSGMVQAAAQANKSLSSISKKAGETASVLLSLKRAAETFGSFYLVKEGIGSLIEAQKQLQAIHYTLIAATGSSTKAADAMSFVTEQSNKLGLILPDAAQGFANLSASATAAGVSMTDQQELFDAYAKSATSLHLSTTQSSRALLALEQMFAKGKIQAQELRLQLGQAIPGAAQRFQNAVMEMTKGTDLAGKSFDQLLEAGALTTSKFLPALVQALQESGRGWEDASHGLNANLNRVQTAWFNLKAEVSGGLFNDAATAGAGLLADNLSRVASLVTLIGAGGLTRIAGGAANTGASKVTRLQQEYQGARMAAAAEIEYAQAIEKTALADKAEAQAAVARQAKTAAVLSENRKIAQARAADAEIQGRLSADAAQKAQAEAQRTGALAEVVRTRNGYIAAGNIAAAESAQAVAAAEARRVGIAAELTAALSSQSTAQKAMVGITAENTKAQIALADADLQLARAKAFAHADDPAIIELTARQTAANEALAASQKMLAAATRDEAVARGAAASLKEASIGADNALIKANIALAASEDAVAAAQARVAETRAAEAALGGLAATAGRAAKSFGAFAMGLVGGPWGLAIAAIAGVSYAIYKVNKDWEDYLAEADKVAKGNEEVTQSLKDMAAAYTNVATRPDAGALSAGLDAAGKSAADAQKELDGLIAKRAKLQDYQKDVGEHSFVAWTLGVSEKLGDLDAKIAHARGTLDDLTAASSKAQMQLIAELAPAIRNSANPALDFLATKVYGARDAFDALHNLASLPSMFSDFIPQAIAASKALDAYTKETGASEAAALKLIQSHGKSNEGLAQVRYELLQSSAAYKNMTADQKAAAKASYESDAALGSGLDALKEKHKKLSPTVADAYESMKNAQEGQLATLRGQLAGTDGYSEAQKTLNKMLAGGTGEFRKMTEAERASIIATQRKIVADTQAVELMNLKIDGARKLADLDREIANEQADRARQNAAAVEGVGHGSQWNAERQAIDEVTAATQKKLEAQRTAYNQQIDLATKANKTAAERKEIDENNLQMIGKIVAGGAVAAQQTQDQFAAMRAAQASWANGLQAGIENFQTQQQNNAAAAQKMVDDLTSGFSSAFVGFVDGAKSAKDAFGSFIDDMYKQALKFLADKAIQALFDSFSQTGGGSKTSTPGSSAGGWGSFIGNFVNALSSRGGKAEGGPVAPGSVHQVAERGPEVLQVGGRSYLLMGAQGGNVIPNHQLGGAGKGSVTYVTNVNVQPTSTRRTADQTAEAAARALRVATTRNG